MIQKHIKGKYFTKINKAKHYLRISSASTLKHMKLVISFFSLWMTDDVLNFLEAAGDQTV